MKILLVHYRYYEWGGPERYLFGLKDRLEADGHVVVPFSLAHEQNAPSPYTDYFASPIGDGRARRFGEEALHPAVVWRKLGRTFYSPHVEARLDRLIRDTQPDVLYALQYQRHLSPAILVAAKRHKVPTVVRMSDYEAVCPQAHLLRDGRVCEECVERRSLWPSVWHGCVSGSRLHSLVNAMAAGYHAFNGYLDLADAIVTPSRMVFDKLRQGGFDPDRAAIIPTFVDTNRFSPGDTRASERRTFVYVGQIRPEKGVDVLIRAWRRASEDVRRAGVKLVIAGSGPPAHEAHIRGLAAGDPTIEFTGAVSGDGIAGLLRDARMSIIPSTWYENLPNSLLESYASGTPVIASAIGSLLEAIAEGRTGWTFEPGNDAQLAALIRRGITDSDAVDAMSAGARARAIDEYGASLHLTRLLALFDRLIVTETIPLATAPSWI